jgi:hypothetical protein
MIYRDRHELDKAAAGGGRNDSFKHVQRFAGAGIRGGAFVKDRPVRVKDLGATIFHALNVPAETRMDRDGLTKPVSTGEPLLELFG